MNPALTEAIEDYCRARQGALQGLPDGCQPRSLCALAHQDPWTFGVVLFIGVLLGVMMGVLLSIAKRWGRSDR